MTGTSTRILTTSSGGMMSEIFESFLDFVKDEFGGVDILQGVRSFR